MLNKLSLRMRLTILTGLVIICIAICLTLTSINNAKNKFNSFEKTAMIPLKKITIAEKTNATEIEINGDIPIDSKNQSDSVAMALIVHEAKKEFTYSSVIYMIVIIVIGMSITYIIAGRALKPVKDLNNTIKNINEHNLSKRIEDFTANDEIGSLAKSFNTMMDRLDKSFSNQKNFASNAAHELKTPLAIIKASIQVLKLDENPSVESYKENIEITEKNAQRLIQVVDDLLKLNSQQCEKFVDSIEIQKIFFNIIDELKPIIEQKGIKVSLFNCNQTILGNKTLIYRALFNIVENSTKYNKQYGEITISTQIQDDTIIINISDTGIGINDNEIQYIFEPFYRVDKSRSRETAGSGLGLSIVKTIIEKHHGNIYIQSEKDVGTSFKIVLPTIK